MSAILISVFYSTNYILRSFLTISLSLLALTNYSQIVVKYKDADFIIQKELVGDNPDVRIENVKFKGASEGLALFYNPNGDLPVNKGFVLTTGDAQSIKGPNDSFREGKPNYSGWHSELAKLANGNTFDASAISFDFYANSSQIEFRYFFASEEYPEYVNKGVNDVFGFFVQHPDSSTLLNIAVLPNSKLTVSVDNINQSKNSNYYCENPMWDDILTGKLEVDKSVAQISYAFEFDGYTRVLIAKADVVPYQKYNLSLVIADVGDNIYDSGVFIERHSFKSVGQSPLVSNVLLDNDLIIKLQQLKGSFTKIDRDSIRLDVPFNFAFNDTLIDLQYHLLLDNLSEKLLQYFDMKVQIIGHTDNVGSYEYNMALSENRALAVRSYLIQKGVESSRINSIGVGSTCPISKNEQAKNRRVECVLFK